MTIRSLRRARARLPGAPAPRSRIRRPGCGSEATRSSSSSTRPALAIVGARACSGYGRSVARLLATEAAAAGAVVVSGMARGIDGEAHRGALAAHGTTVAVLGCGVDRDYPAAHAELARAIVAGGGLVVSEYEPGIEPAPWRFPARNRIIAGLARATVVVEARERSGALITADFALEDGREVLAVPGEITSALSQGTNALLRLGATPVTSAADVLEAMGLTPHPAVAVRTTRPPVRFSPLSTRGTRRSTSLAVRAGSSRGRWPARSRCSSSRASCPRTTASSAGRERADGGPAARAGPPPVRGASRRCSAARAPCRSRG